MYQNLSDIKLNMTGEPGKIQAKPQLLFHKSLFSMTAKRKQYVIIRRKYIRNSKSDISEERSCQLCVYVPSTITACNIPKIHPPNRAIKGALFISEPFPLRCDAFICDAEIFSRAHITHYFKNSPCYSIQKMPRSPAALLHLQPVFGMACVV